MEMKCDVCGVEIKNDNIGLVRHDIDPAKTKKLCKSCRPKKKSPRGFVDTKNSKVLVNDATTTLNQYYKGVLIKRAGEVRPEEE